MIVPKLSYIREEFIGDSNGTLHNTVGKIVGNHDSQMILIAKEIFCCIIFTLMISFTLISMPAFTRVELNLYDLGQGWLHFISK